MEVLSRTLCTSSLRTIFGGLVSPGGCLDKVSGALFFTPGTWTILKRYRKVFSFRFLSLVLVMLSRDLSPNILRSGLWSTAIVRFLHPRTKCLALSRASATASASPSIGAYLDSAAWVNLLPTRVIFLVCSRRGRWRGTSSVSGTASNQCLVLTSQLPGTWVWFCRRF